jgi:hypothetical protein
VGLGLANLWKFGFLSWALLASKKDALDSISKLVTIATVSTGAILSYFRFFRGRTFSLRAELSIAATPHKRPDGKWLYVITVAAKNVGTMTIWEAYPNVELHLLKAEGNPEVVRINVWHSPRSDSSSSSVRVLDPAETALYFFHHVAPLETWGITIFASVSSDTGDSWHTATTIANDPPEGKTSST